MFRGKLNVSLHICLNDVHIGSSSIKIICREDILEMKRNVCWKMVAWEGWEELVARSWV